ncbi:MAG: hypothetical protein JXQ65_08320 [Candidatus Marinimicrobia bacterium]|nr:hypothetical protein [Candidatus Neomarinimicrobiota bacterium]
MKKYLIFGLLFLFSCGTETIVKESNQYQKEAEIKASKDIIVARSIQWLEDYYSIRGNVLEKNEKKSMRIVSDRFLLDNNENISCTLDINIQDNRLKITYKNIQMNNGREVSQIVLKKLEPRMNTAIYNLQLKILAG